MQKSARHARVRPSRRQKGVRRGFRNAPADPRPTRQPRWVPFRVQAQVKISTSSGSHAVSAKDLQTGVILALGISAPSYASQTVYVKELPAVDMQIHSVSAWMMGSSGGNNGSLGLALYTCPNPMNTAAAATVQSIVSSLSDRPGKNSWARVRCSWPRGQQYAHRVGITLPVSNQPTVPTFTTTWGGDALIVDVEDVDAGSPHLPIEIVGRWRFYGTDLIQPTVQLAAKRIPRPAAIVVGDEQRKPKEQRLSPASSEQRERTSRSKAASPPVSDSDSDLSIVKSFSSHKSTSRSLAWKQKKQASHQNCLPDACSLAADAFEKGLPATVVNALANACCKSGDVWNVRVDASRDELKTLGYSPSAIARGRREGTLPQRAVNVYSHCNPEHSG